MDTIVKAWGRVAQLANCAIELVQHARKSSAGETEITVESSRGGKALMDGCRSVRVLSGCPGVSVRDLAECSPMPSNVSFRPTRSFQPAGASRYLDSVPVAHPEMPKSKFTEADVRRAVKGVFDGGGRVSSVEIWPDGRISVTVKEDKHRSMDPEDDPEVSRRLL